MGVYEIKQKYLQSIQNTYQMQVTVLNKVSEQLQAYPEETKRIQLEFQKKRIEEELTRLEGELLKAEADVQKWGTLTRKPPDSFVKRNPVHKATDTSPPEPIKITVFNVAGFGEIKIEPVEVNELLTSPTDQLDLVTYMRNVQNAISSVGRLELNGVPVGTAILVSKNRVITSWKVVEEYFQNVQPDSESGFTSFLDKLNLIGPDTSQGLWVRFTRYTENGQKGQLFQVKQVLKKPKENNPDYALLELEEAVTKFKVAPFSNSVSEEGQILKVLDYSQGHTLKQSIAKVKKVQTEKILYLGNLENISPCCPVFNDRWELVGIHLGVKSLTPEIFLAGLKFEEALLIQSLLDNLAKENLSF